MRIGKYDLNLAGEYRTGAELLKRGVVATVVFIAACDSREIRLCFVDGDDAVHVSPSGRAVAFVNPASYQAILDAPFSARLALDCAVDEFASRLDSEAEAVVFTFDYEETSVTLARLMHERGFEWYPDSGISEDQFFAYGIAQREVLAIAEDIPDPPPWALNVTYRQLEQGVGNPRESRCSPRCPPLLRGWIFLPTRESLVAGRFLHEFTHFWAAHLDGPPVLAAQINRFEGHWGLSSVNGLLGGWDPASFEATGDGVYHADVVPAGKAQNRSPYAPLELYLMGLLGPDGVDPIQVAVGATRLGEDEDGRDIFRADRIETISIDDIIAANGPRVPSAEETDKVFSIALVVLTDQELTEQEWDFYERAMDFLEGDADTDLLGLFPADEYPGHQDWWQFTTRDPGERFFNFSAVTMGIGAMRFDVGERR